MKAVRLRLALVWVSIIVISLMFVGQSYAKIDLETCVGMWLLDEGKGDVIRDSSGNGLDGTITGNLKWVKGKFGSGLQYVGNGSDFASVKHRDSMDLETYTLMAWTKLTDRADYQCIVGKEEPFGVGNYSLFLNKETKKPINEFWIKGVYKGILAKTVITDDEWHHVAGTYDKKFMKIYVDGVMEGQMAESGSPDKTPGVLRIGVRINGGNPLMGVLDEVGIFNVALTEANLKSIMEQGFERALGISAVEPTSKLTTTWGSIKKH